MNKYKKVCDTSIRVLETLKLLSNDAASVQDIIRHFEKIDPNNRIYTNEVILKYINTLKVFGFRFAKEKDKYILLNTISQFNFNEKDLNALRIMEKFGESLPEEKIKSELNQYMQELEKRFDDNTRLLAHSINRPDFIPLINDYSKYSEQIKTYEKYCLDEQRLKITYKNQNEQEISMMVEPNEIKYFENKVFLSVYNPSTAEISDININSIVEIAQLPLKSNPTNIYSSVTFRLKDRLAKAYKLHEGEELLKLESNGNTIILNKKEDRTLLLKRLMRYGEYCEVISPKSLREQIKQIIKTTLNNYK